MMCLLISRRKMSLAQFFGIDKLQKLARMVKEHGGVKASLYHFYLTDDLKVGPAWEEKLFPVPSNRVTSSGFLHKT
jgi:hypothetical protein